MAGRLLLLDAKPMFTRPAAEGTPVRSGVRYAAAAALFTGALCYLTRSSDPAVVGWADRCGFSLAASLARDCARSRKRRRSPPVGLERLRAS